MKVLLNSNLVPLFRGTYESIWEVNEYEDNGDEVEVDYKFEDLMKSIVEAYKNEEKWILSELNLPFVKDIKFTGEFYSPREYNFVTDEIDFKLDISKAQLVKTLDSLKENQEFKEFLAENYTSYDGFMSFTPNNYNEIRENILSTGSEYEQSISAVI